MKTEAQIDSLLKRIALKSEAKDANWFAISYSKMVQRAAAERRIRRAITCGVIPLAALLGVLVMWMMEIPPIWIGGGMVASAGIIGVFLVLVRRMLP